MKIYVPRLELAAISPPQTRAMDKFGGLPWGLPTARWPRCRQCGHAMALIAQFFHDDRRLDLGAAGRCLFVFMCATPLSGCETSSPESGANTGFVLEPQELGSGLTWPPDADASWPVWTNQCCGQAGAGNYRDKVWIEVEARVLRWCERDEDVDENCLADFSDPSRFGRIAADLLPRVYPGTKLGGAPYWWQDPQVPEGAGFCAQFASWLEFPPPLPAADDVGCTITIGGREILRRTEPRIRRHDTVNEICDNRSSLEAPEGNWCCSAANYGMGMAYLFLVPNGVAAPACHFFWQC